MIAHERHHRMLEFLGEHGRAGLADLLALTGASPATLRRDLEFLGGRDLLVRQHGAVLHPSAAAAEPSLLQKAQSATAAKRKIGALAAKLVPEGATVFIDSGTTCQEVARILRSLHGLTIITNSLPVIAGHEHFQAKLIVVGGERRAVSGALVGGSASGACSALKADIAMIGASGLDVESGPGTTELLERDIKAAWIRNARRTVLLSDASKWESASTIGFASWNEMNDFVTDKKPPAGFRPKTTRIHFL